MKPRVQQEVARRQALEAKRAARLADWSRGASPGPFKLMYFPTNACNLSCAICWQRKGVHDYSELAPARQIALVDEAIALDVREFVIGGGGEPLTRWKQLRPVFQRIRDAGMYGMLFTNGTLITDEVAKALVDMRWNKVLISLDGLTGANDLVREDDSYKRIVAGLDRLLAARGDSELPVIGVGCVMTKQGILELPDLVRFLGERDCDQLNLIRLLVHLADQRKFAVPRAELGEFQGILQEARTAAAASGMVTNLAEYADSDVVSQTDTFENVLLSDRTQTSGADPFWGALCFEPFSNVVIHANGMVGPCCMSGDDPVASVVDRTLTDVWLGTEFSRLRHGILARQPESYCKTCDLNVFAENQRLRILGESQ